MSRITSMLPLPCSHFIIIFFLPWQTMAPLPKLAIHKLVFKHFTMHIRKVSSIENWYQWWVVALTIWQICYLFLELLWVWNGVKLFVTIRTQFFRELWVLLAILLKVQKTMIPRDIQRVVTMSLRFGGRKKRIQMGIELESVHVMLCKRSVRIGLWGGWK